MGKCRILDFGAPVPRRNRDDLTLTDVYQVGDTHWSNFRNQFPAQLSQKLEAQYNM